VISAPEGDTELPYAGDGVLTNSHADFDGLGNGRRSRRSSTGLTVRARATARSTTACAIGCSAASATGAARSRSSRVRSAGSCRCRRTSCGRAARHRRISAQGTVAAGGRQDWVNVDCPQCVRRHARDRTMDTFVDSSWYFLRYCDAQNDQAAWDPEIVAKWMPVDQYIGGVEHAILHLLYARSSARRCRTSVTSTCRSRSRGSSRRDDHQGRREDVQVQG